MGQQEPEQPLEGASVVSESKPSAIAQAKDPYYEGYADGIGRAMREHQDAAERHRAAGDNDNARMDDAWATAFRALAEKERQLVAPSPVAQDAIAPVQQPSLELRLLRDLISHWNEFGPENGFGEKIDSYERAINPPFVTLAPPSTLAQADEIEQYLHEGFSVKVLNMGKNYWRCPHCGMADFDGHEQSCLIRVMAERLAGKVIPFAGAKPPSATAALTVETFDGVEPAIPVAAARVIQMFKPEDHACAECYPHGENIIPGFRCYHHEAMAVLRALDRGGRE